MLFCDLNLARRLERAEGLSAARFVEARAKAVPESGAEWKTVGGAYALFDKPESPVTQTFGLGMFETATAEMLDEIETFFAQRQAPVYHEVCPLAGVELFALLAERGYKPVELSSVMFRPLDAASQNKSAVRTRQIQAGENQLWVEVAGAGWSATPGIKDFFDDLGRINEHRKEFADFFGELEGFAKPIATASLSLSNNVAHMAGASTVPEARGLGAQNALLAARLNYAIERGCDLAMMAAEPGGESQRNAERNGFRIAYTRVKWGKP